MATACWWRYEPVVLLKVEDLAVRFPTEEGEVHAVDGISFEVAGGEVFGLVGESGCGKSATSLAILGLIPRPGRISSGSVSLEGVDLVGLDSAEMRQVRGRRIAMIFQDPMTALNPVISIGEQLGEMLRLHLHLSHRRAHQRAIELLESVGISAPAQRVQEYPHQLSGGMRQRVMIAMALSCDPVLLLADEPTTALDVTVQSQILALLRELPDQGRAILLITHDLGVVAENCDRVAVMYAGQIVETASVGRLFGSPRHPYTWGLMRSVPRLDTPRDEPLQPIEGAPPDLLHPPVGCRFHPRCSHSRDICREVQPALTLREADATPHLAACHGTAEGGWL